MKFIYSLEQTKTSPELEVTDMTQILILLYPVECKLQFSFVYLTNSNVHRYANGTYYTHTHTDTHTHTHTHSIFSWSTLLQNYYTCKKWLLNINS
jgi:hypothetical protein